MYIPFLFGQRSRCLIGGISGFGVFATWWWPKYYYVILPWISASVVMELIMIINLIITTVYRWHCPETLLTPEKPESLVFLIPCYNETKDAIESSLQTLVAQKGMSDHPRCVLIVCDGNARGPGMEKTTAEYLLDDILTKDDRVQITQAYQAWDQQWLSVEVQKGVHHGVPYFCIVKKKNKGKRDSLIVVRSFLYNYNLRASQIHTSQFIFSSELLGYLTSFMEDSGIASVDYLVGMDADTTFDDHCVSELVRESRYKDTVGVCGYVAVDWGRSPCDLWKLYQSAEYTIAQCLRRLHQSIVTHKVSCLPGCCQLLKVCEETCGTEVLLERFGYCPTLSDGIVRQIRATASEDRNHVCHMLSARPNVQTRQALRAVAYTDVPQTWSVFLSQRRRWTLGATSNDLLLVFARGVQWFERILACTNVLTWFLNILIFASMARFVFVICCEDVEKWVLVCFAIMASTLVLYYAMIPIWNSTPWRECFRFWVGCFLYIICGPFINIAVLLYACWYMDSFGWGKTRQVICEDTEAERRSPVTEETPLLVYT